MRRSVSDGSVATFDETSFADGENGTMSVAAGAAPIGVDVETPRSRDDSDKHNRASARVAAERSTSYRSFRRTCDQLRLEIGRIDEFVDNGIVTDEGLEVVVEVEHLLESLYDCPWGEGESLKRVIVAIQSQVANAVWTAKHVDFLKDVIARLRVRYLINADVVNDCYELIETHGLEEFRGSVTETETRKKYRIEEVK
jgi:hypothetical protein